MKEMKEWFSARNYTLTYRAIEPVWKRCRVYAVASPNACGAWLVFYSKDDLKKYVAERSHNEQIGIVA